MVTVFFSTPSFVVSTDVEEGTTIMEAAQQLQLPHIPATCGGNCACATCHVKVDKQWLSSLPEIEETSIERDLLEMLKTYDEETSRLSCQIPMTKELDGITVYLVDDELL